MFWISTILGNCLWFKNVFIKITAFFKPYTAVIFWNYIESITGRDDSFFRSNICIHNYTYSSTKQFFYLNWWILPYEISGRNTNKHFSNSYHFWNSSKDVYIDIYGYLCMYLDFDIKGVLPYFHELPNVNIFYWRSSIFLAFCASSNPVIKFLVHPLFLCISFKIFHEGIRQCNHPCSRQFSSM